MLNYWSLNCQNSILSKKKKKINNHIFFFVLFDIWFTFHTKGDNHDYYGRKYIVFQYYQVSTLFGISYPIDNWHLLKKSHCNSLHQHKPNDNFALKISNPRHFLSSLSYLFSKINLSLFSQKFSNISSLSLSVSSPLKFKSQNFKKFEELKFSLSNTLPFTCD